MPVPAKVLQIVKYLRSEPVMVWSVLSSIVALAASYGFNLTPTAHDVVWGLVALLLGGGAAVRSQVTPV